uniref:Transmembrane protein n=1 Tax=Schizaphis graminum TaxID=13262 RepID=A0A2S2PBZ7_SCHGA
MLKTCFGCCPLKHGVSTIALINIIWNITEVFKHIHHRDEQYKQYDWVNNSNHNSSVSLDDNSTTEEPDYWSDLERIPVMSGIYMDYIFIISISWVVLELISNCCLKQSTFKRAPQKIYAWLVIYYANLSFMILHLVHYIILMIRYPTLMYTLLTQEHQNFSHFFLKLIYITIISLEITIIHSYYIIEEKNMLNDIVQLKWKYVSRGQVVSRGVDYTSLSTFNATTSGQTQEGSRIPPYITNVIQN